MHILALPFSLFDLVGPGRRPSHLWSFEFSSCCEEDCRTVVVISNVNLFQRLWGFYSFKVPALGWSGSFWSPLLLILVLETDDTSDLGFFHSSVQSAHLNKLHFHLTLDAHVNGTFL